MPYIKKEERKPYKKPVNDLFERLEGKPAGHMNYVISRLLWKMWYRERSYTMGCKIAGTLILVLFEFVRRNLNKYEGEKIIENGDLYDLDIHGNDIGCFDDEK
ncbi:hypothetical protein LCGC14_1039430 [marine sediment metagenome]|uniref:Uncharacterized protein n=1 Tax=marine sediment metagenome TaxID=412755 RepID=A0A0F9MS75_9ZZZZ